MNKTQSGSVLHYLRNLSVLGEDAQRTDRQLLERFCEGNQAAFASLVKRHGRLVWDVCRRALGNEQDAEDSFQAVFVVLAYKAGSVRKRDSLGSWLHGVALRTAMNAKRKAARRHKHEHRYTPPAAVSAEARTAWQEAQTLLDEEVQRLPGAWQEAFVCCCMEGKSLADAARELGKTQVAVATVLSRARKRLQQRLRERDVGLSLLLGAVALTRTEALAAIPARLIHSTIRAAASVAAHRAVTARLVSGPVAALAKVTMNMMMRWPTLRWGLLVAALLSGALAGGGTWCSASPSAKNALTEDPATPNRATADSRSPDRKRAAHIAWGQAVNGVQAGLEVARAEPTCPLGEAVRFVVWLRNVSERAAKVTYHPGWFYTSTPVVRGAEGKPMKLIMPEPDVEKGPNGQPSVPVEEPIFELTLAPGEQAALGPPRLGFAPAESQGAVKRPTVRTAPGVCKVQYERISLSHPGLKTAQAEILVRPANAAKQKEQEPLTGNALKLADSSWQEADGKAGPTFHVDGTGLNRDGSKFEWRVEGDLLLARSLKEKGPPAGWVKIPMLFSRDGKEHRFVWGKHEYRRFRISTATGKPDDERTEEGQRFSRCWLPPQEEENETPGPETKDGTAEPVPDQTAHTKVSISAGPNVQVSKANADVFHAEVVLAADPKNARRLVAASMYSPPPVDPSAPKIIVYTSSDGGKSWAPKLERKDASPASLADPAFAWGAEDALFFVNMWAPSLAKLPTAGCLQVVRSRDGGQTWDRTTTIKEYHDRPFLAVDTTKGKYQGRLYCLTHKGLLVSTDAGTSFGSLRSWPRRLGYVAVGSGTPLVLSDGTLVVLYNNDFHDPANGQIVDPRKRQSYLAVRASHDGGDSFAEEYLVANYTGEGYPQAAVAPAHTAWRDRAYVVWQETPAGGHRCIRYAYSKDGGLTFSRPVVLSEQSEPVVDYDAFLPSIVVNRAGVVGVTWYDTRRLRAGGSGWDVRFRASLDGGDSWEPSVQVNDAPTRKNKKTNKRIQGVGHTAGLAADADGIFHCLWVDGRTGFSQVFTTTVTVELPKKP
jgi:RNA polymerase sigma factor (sigma-70 family)